LGTCVNTPCYDSAELSDEEKPRLSAKLFARKSLEDRINTLNKADGVIFKPSTEMIIEDPPNIVIPSGDQPEKPERSFENIHQENNPFADVSSDASEETENCSPIPEASHSEDDNNNVDENSDDSDTNNPFGDDSDAEEEEITKEDQTADSTNPFGDPSDGEESDPEKENPGNPFGSASEEDEGPPGNPFGDPDVKAKPPPRPSKPPTRPPPPNLKPKKKKAPLPPPDVAAFHPGRPRRPPPPRPKGMAPGHGHPLIKRGVENDEEGLKAEMKSLEEEMRDLESQGAKLEDMLRFSNNSGNWGQVRNNLHI